MDSVLTEQELMATLDVPLDRDVFLRTLVRELAATLEDVVGCEQAAGFISTIMVGAPGALGLRFDSFEAAHVGS